MTIGFWIEFILSAIVTAATYGAGPMLLAKLRKKPLSVWKLRLFCAAYTILIWVVWQFLTYDGNSVRTMPAMFWGYVFYRLARSAFEKKTAQPYRQMNSQRNAGTPALNAGSLSGMGKSAIAKNRSRIQAENFVELRL